MTRKCVAFSKTSSCSNQQLYLKKLEMATVEEAENVSYPLIDPTVFDLVVIGTGLPESIIAAAASTAGKTVLHLDSNSFYGSHFSSLTFTTFISFLLDSQQNQPPPTSTTHGSDHDSDYVSGDLKPRSLYSNIEISSLEEDQIELFKKISLDISGPRVLLCADSAVKLLLNSGASHHVEFKSIDASFVYGSDGQLSSVPDSRSAIFKDKTLGLIEKNQLKKFFNLVQEHFSNGGSDEGNEDDELKKTDASKRISDEDLETPFVEFLRKQRLPPKIKSIILYAIAMADYDQEMPEFSKNLLNTKDGIERLALFHSSVGMFTNALGAMIYPIYGQGELPQAFCRCAAVKGALYVLRMPVTALLLSKETGHCKGVRLASGQEISSQHVVMSPSFIIPSPPVSTPAQDSLMVSSDRDNQAADKSKVARGICITRGSIKQDSNLLVTFPPRSLYPEQVSSVRALQLGSNVAVCPSGLFVLYLSTLCDDAIEGKKSLYAAMDALLACPPSENPEDSTSTQTGSIEVRPTLLWKATYVQELLKGSSGGGVISCPTPDGNMDYTDILDSSVKLFHEIYDEEFFPMAKASENPEDDDEGLED